jgi:hypothetical protein
MISHKCDKCKWEFEGGCYCDECREEELGLVREEAYKEGYADARKEFETL